MTTMDKKLTDSEIVKAFEVLDSWQQVALQNDDGTDTESPKLYEAIEIVRKQINHQKAENESLKISLAQYISNSNADKAEIERLKNHIQEGIDLAKQIPEMLALAKAEAYKEFVDKLCEGRVSNDNTVILAKCLLKELVGEDK